MEYTFTVIMSMYFNLGQYGIQLNCNYMCVCALIMVNMLYTFTLIMSLCINLGQYGIHLHCN